VQRIEFFTDYRQFLRDYYEERKQLSRSFSYRQFCLKADIRSPSLFLEVVEGRRNLTETSVVQFAKGLGLDAKDSHYFSTLVKYNQARDSKSKQKWFDELRGLRSNLQIELVPFDRHEYYARWYFPVLRELACITDWDGDHAALGRLVRPTLGARQVRDGIDLLVRLGFIEQVGNQWRQTAPALTSGTEVDSLLVRSCNRQFADLAAEAIDEVPPAHRDASSMIVGISTEGFRRIKEEIRSFKQRIARIAEEDSGTDRVYAMSIQFVPHSVIGHSA